MMEEFLLMFCVLNFAIMILGFGTFKTITDNQNELIQVLNDDLQRLRDDGK